MSKTHIPPTDKELKVLYFIEDFMSDNKGRSPSRTEIQRALKIKSPSVVEYYIQQLIDKGELKRNNNKTRNLEVLKGEI